MPLSIASICRFSVAAALLLVAAPALAVDVTATTDICGPTDDPCQLTFDADIANGTTLDFGLRTLSVTGNGLIDFNSGSGSILCGGVVASVGTRFLKARGLVDGGGAEGGIVRLTARRGCSNSPSTPCLRDSDCGAGTCSVGSGAMNLDGQIFGSGVEPGTVILRAAGDVTLSKSVNLDGSTGDSDGGELDVESTLGSIVVNGPISVTSGRDSEGGSVALSAKQDVVVNQLIDASGGDFDGGAVDIAAGRDYSQAAVTVNVGSVAGSGSGGTLFIDAGRTLSIAGGSAINRLRVIATGSGADDFGGDGGEIDLRAGTNIALPDFTRFENDGARPDGAGGDFFFEADGDILIDGHLVSKSLGADGGGGQVTIKSKGGVVLGSTASFDLTGGNFGAGYVEFESAKDFTAAGVIDMSGTGGGAGGGVDIQSDAGITLSGVLRTAGNAGSGADGELLVRGCRIEMLSGSSLDNRAINGENRIEARETFALRSGATMTAGETGGTNRIRHRRADRPPVIQGIVSPTPIVEVAPSLVDCPLCGNGEVERGETCDDGNTVAGDGCDATCVNEACIADTPGYPTTALCNDGDPCTVDTCAAEGCSYGPRCDDGIDCTVDTCDNGQCTNAPDDSACTDDNGCTDDLCIGTVGCTFVNNTDPCDDGLFCTVDDICGGGTCGGTARDCSDGVSCTVDVCDDASNSCTSTPDDGLCDDDSFCNGAETCDATLDCLSGTAVDCSDLDTDCLEGQCDDGVDACASLPVNEDEACDDGRADTDNDRCVNGFCIGDDVDCNDFIPCTVDRFDDDLQACVNTPDNAVCNDRQFCNGVETCSAETGCVAGTPVDCSSLDSVCALGACDERRDRCGTAPANEGTGCDDGMFCTVADSCRAGRCTGDPRDCSDGVGCTLDGCNDTVDECRNIVQDQNCNDGLFCNGVETCHPTLDCQAGTAIDCSVFDDTCEAGVCNDDFNVCVTEAANEGQVCDDGDVCTDTDRCRSGVCRGEDIVDCGICGNGLVDEGEDCDDGDLEFLFGEACAADCSAVRCAQPTGSTGVRPNASDALFILRAAVALATCDARVCDADGNGSIRASDALLALNAAVGRPVVLACPDAA
jgi:hypothetical protein